LTLPEQPNHLPSRKQREITRVMQIVFTEFEDGQKTKVSDKSLG